MIPTIRNAVFLLVVSSILTAAQRTADDFEVLQLRPNFYMIAGAGGNIGVQVGDDGVVVVDAGSASTSDAVVTTIKKITTRPIRYVIDTNADSDHVGGNEALAKAGHLKAAQAKSRIICPRRILSLMK